MEKTIRIQNFLDDNRISPFQWLIFLACFLVAFFDGMDTAAIGYIAPSLSDDWGIGKKDLAPVLSGHCSAWPWARLHRDRWPTNSAGNRC